MSQAPRDTRSAAEKARDTASIIGRLKHEGAERFSIGEGGTIAAWAQNSGSAAVTAFDDGVVNGPEHAVYKGLALGNVSGANYLYATDLHNNKVDVFDTNFAKPAATQGKFVDPGMPAGFVPFGITAVKGQLFVTFAMQDAAKHDEMTGAGLGISIFLKPAAILSVDLPPPEYSMRRGELLLRRQASPRCKDKCWSATFATVPSTPSCRTENHWLPPTAP